MNQRNCKTVIYIYIYIYLFNLIRNYTQITRSPLGTQSVFIYYKNIEKKNLKIKPVGTRFDLNPEQEWIQAHVAQTMNL